MQVKDLSVDLQNGLLLVQLLDKLASPKTVGRYSKNPINMVHMIENLGKALQFIRDQDIKLVNIGKDERGRSFNHRLNHLGVCKLGPGRQVRVKPC